MNKEKTAVIFGGTGFIGLHFARYLMETGGFSFIILADLKPPKNHVVSKFVDHFLMNGSINFVVCDVRQPIGVNDVTGGRVIDLIVNFAAIHREPGHEPYEYFETNLLGARHVCEFAEASGCEDILFTSSISPYGPSEVARTEASVPTPETAYGSSKLAAELIHAAWRDRGQESRRLLIVRPGVVFGPGEGGNVSRLVKMLSKRGFFVFAGNEKTRKAGIYIKELCNAIWWLHEKSTARPPSLMSANMTMDPGPSMKDYVDSVQRVAGKKAFVPSIPAW